MLLYAGCVIVAGIVAACSVRAILRALRYARVARELDEIHRITYRERSAARGPLRCG